MSHVIDYRGCFGFFLLFLVNRLWNGLIEDMSVITCNNIRSQSSTSSTDKRNWSAARAPVPVVQPN